MRVLKNFAIYFCSYPRRSSQRCLAAEFSTGWRQATPRRELVQDLPAVLLKSKADSTARKYEKGFNTWRKWASQFKEIVIFPASSVYVSLFFLILQSLIQESASCSSIDEVHYGLKWVHDLAGLPDPCNSSLVLSLIESAKRLLSIPVKRKSLWPSRLFSFYLLSMDRLQLVCLIYECLLCAF